jgi:anti-sigma B factor antagonist
MKIQINTQSFSGVAVISLSGALTAEYADSIEQAVKTALGQSRVLILDCEQLDLLDSTGLGALIRCLRASLAARSRLCLANVKTTPRMVFQLTRTHQLFDIYDSVTGALANLETEEKVA